MFVRFAERFSAGSMDSDAKNYEIAYIISPTVREEDIFGVVGKITSAVQDAKGIVNKIEEPRRIKLAYPIKKQTWAHFGWTAFSVAGEGIGELKKRLARDPSILRYLIVCIPQKAYRAARRKFRPKGKIERPAIPARPTTPETQEQEKKQIAEIDKKLEEILGK